MPSRAATPISASQSAHQSSPGLSRGTSSNCSGRVRSWRAAKAALQIGLKLRRNRKWHLSPGQSPRPTRIAAWNSPVEKSISLLSVESLTARFGCLTWKLPIRGASQVVAKVCAVLIESKAWSSATMPEKASSSVSNALATSGAARRPASVSDTRPLWRANKGTPSRSSSKRI